MSNSQGTIETIAQELTKLLQPLKDDLNVVRARALFAELGIAIPQPQIELLSTPLNATVNETLLLVQKSKELKIVIEAEDIVGITQKAREVVEVIKSVIESLSNIRTAIEELSLPGIPDNLIEKIPERLFNYLLVRYLERMYGVVSVLSFLGVINQTEENIGSGDPSQPPFTSIDFNLSKINNWIRSPAKELKSLYQWGETSFDGRLLLSKLEDIFSRMAIPVIYDESGPLPKLDLIVFEIIPKTDISPKGIAINLKEGISHGNVISDDDFEMTFDVDFELPVNTELLIQPNGNVLFIPPEEIPLQGKALFNLLVAKKINPEPYVILGQANGSRLEILSFNLKAGSDFIWDNESTKGSILIEGKLNGGKLMIDTSDSDGFLQSILPSQGVESEFDLGLGYSSDKGLYLTGSAALDIHIPVHISLGPVSIEGLTLAVKIKDGKIPVEIGADLKTQLGPLTAMIQNMGMKATFSFPSDNTGNLGPLQFDLGFKPPTGIGLSIDSGGFKGGGILNFDKDKAEYFGALELEFKELFSLKVFGIINTRMPDGSPGFSLLLIITAEFTPIQLGFGFTLMGVGGLLGLNRTVRLDVLKEGIKTNALKSILFPEDIVANINRIVSDVKAVFPVQEGHFIICPMGKLGWGSPAIITLELGILVEIPVAGFAILGVLKAVLPDEQSALLKLQINFLGIADFDNRSFSLDGTLYDSKLLVYTLTGDMAFRLSYGDHPVFILSVGGFHPAFKEAPADLQKMDRLAITLFNSDSAWIKVQTYFAVTSNTIQFGARAELFAGSTTGFNIYGFLGYDVLFQFDPFRFIADFSAGFALRKRNSVIMGITASGELSGPSPWDAHGKASVSFFFFSVSVSFHKTWGQSVTAPEPATANLMAMMRTELLDDRNWKADIPANNKLHVSIKQITSDKAIVHPFGILTFSERLLPLNIDIEKFGNKRPQDVRKFEVSTPDPDLETAEAREPFAPANFFTLSDSDKLARPSYEAMQSGFKITGSKAIELPIPVSRPVDYELSYLGSKRTKLKRHGPYLFDKISMKAGSKSGSSASSKLSMITNRESINAPEKVDPREDRFAIASSSDMTLYDSNLMVKSYTEALDHYNRIVRRDPAMAEQIQIVADYELNTN